MLTVLEAGAQAVDPGLVVGALPAPEERGPVAGVAERLGIRLQVPDRVLRVAEIQAREPRLVLAESRSLVEQAVLERELEAGAPAVARADHEIHRIVLRQRRLGARLAVSASERAQLVGVGRAGHRQRQHARGAPDQFHRHRPGEIRRHLARVHALRSARHADRRQREDALIGAGSEPHLQLLGRLLCRGCDHEELEELPGGSTAVCGSDDPVRQGAALGGKAMAGGDERDNERQQPHGVLQSCASAKRATRKSTNRRTFAERCLRLG